MSYHDILCAETSLLNVTVHVHIAPLTESLARALMASANNEIWEFHAPVFSGHKVIYDLMYHLMDPGLLGQENDRSYHHSITVCNPSLPALELNGTRLPVTPLWGITFGEISKL